jgi:hypothetical protein
MALGILNNSTIPMPVLLDAIRHAETGHLSLEDARNARSKKDAIGPYQFLESNLHDMGYKMPKNIDPVLVRDPAAARALAEQYVTGYTDYHGFTTPLQQLAAYNMGPDAAKDWLASGGRISDLPQETREYVQRAAAYLTKQRTEEQPMNDQYLGYFMDGQQAAAPALNMPGANMSAAALNNPMLGPYMDGRAAALADSTQSLTRQQQLQVDKQRILNLLTSPEAGQMTGLFNQIPAELRSDPDIMAAMRSKGLLSAPATSDDGLLTTAANASTTQNNMTYSPMSQTRSSPMPVNRRDQSPMAMPQAPSGIDMNEMLIRVGAAGLGGSARGGLESFQAMGAEYGRIKDAERRSGLDAYKSQMTLLGKNKGKTRPSGNPVSPYNAVVLDTLNDIIPSLDGDTSMFSAEAGFTGALMKAVPGTPAADFAAKIDTLKANIGFDRLQKMRDESPTGGALGQVSEMELRQLNAALGSLEQSQSPQQLQENLMRIRDHYIRAVSALEAEYAAAGIDISSKIQPMTSGNQGMGVGQEMTINGVTVKRIN